ncbi:MAG: hypothetical protein ABJB03_00580 [Rhodoglobus sp.]
MTDPMPLVQPAPRSRWSIFWGGLVIACFLIGAAAAIIFIVQAGHDRDNAAAIQQQQGETIDNLASALDESRHQLQDNGLNPVAPPSSELVPVPGPAGEPGTAGAQGPQGPRGFDGHDGIDGKDGAPGAPGTTGLDGATGPQGDPGPAGAPGNPGADGQPPTSWSFTWVGITYTCQRTEPFDATAPTYTCNTTPPQ